MTGKGCVYTEVIDRTLKERRDSNNYVGFSVMPFRPNLKVFWKNCLNRYFSTNFHGSVELQRADEVRRPGIIICEGVCKRIQESDFITVDISQPNPNVFYELGLAYGIGHKILVICHDEAEFGGKMADELKMFGCNAYRYHGLDPIAREEFDLARNIWINPARSTGRGNTDPLFLFYEHSLGEPDTNSRIVPTGDIDIDFQSHVESAVGLAIAEICDRLTSDSESQGVISSYLETIYSFRNVQPVKTDASFAEIRDQVDSAYCMIIRTGFKDCHPMAYFWLGYGHAQGKNIVPVTVMERRDDDVRDLAFDIRAQRHMIFIKQAPDRFEEELTSSLDQMIAADFADWSRKQFWDRLLGKRGEVSIFTGALHNESFGREMIGDWDLRTASELTSYFARQQYRAKIENPVYTPEYPGREQTESHLSYVRALENMMKDKNCILVASPDVNPLTEIVLGSMYDVPVEALFSESSDGLEKHPMAMVVVKERVAGEGDKKSSAKRFFYREELVKEAEPRRGFRSNQLTGRRMLDPYKSQVEKGQPRFTVQGQIAILPNPFRSKGSADERYIIILNGVSGPATFALTHVLTGGVTKEFSSYSNKFTPEAESEKIVRRMLESIERRHFESLDCLIEVEVGAKERKSERAEADQGDTSDWRKIMKWKLNEGAGRTAIKVLP